MAIFDRIVYMNLAKHCDHHPEWSLETIIPKCRDALIKEGLAVQILRPLDDLPALRQGFRPVIVPNPTFWRRKLHKRFSFLAVESPADRYEPLLQLLESFPNTSHYVCYSDIDVLIRALGEEEELEQLVEYISQRGFSVRAYAVERIPIFYGFPVNQSQSFATPVIGPEEIDRLLCQPADEVSPEIKASLKEGGLILGTIYREDHQLTGRLRAFVAVKLRDSLKPETRSRFEAALLEINPREIRKRLSEPLVSVYDCAGARFSYLIELICDDEGQLDELTDYIQRLHEAVYDTYTMIVAKYVDKAIRYSDTKHDRAQNYFLLSDISQKELQPLLENIRKQFSVEVLTAFIDAPSELRLQALQLYGELKRIEEKQTSASLFKEFVEPLLKSVLKKRVGETKSVGLGLVRDVIEQRHSEVAKLIVNNVFAGTPELFQSELKMSNVSHWKWGLGVWGEQVYDRWNKHSLFGKIMQVPEDVLWSLQVLGRARNAFAHSRDSDFDETVQKVRETWYHGAGVLAWIKTAEDKLRQPHIPVDKA